MPRRFDQRGWNRQFKWQPVRSDRWDMYPKDHLPFVDDFSESSRLHRDSIRLHPIDDMTPSVGPHRGDELFTPRWQYPEPRMLLPYYRP